MSYVWFSLFFQLFVLLCEKDYRHQISEWNYFLNHGKIISIDCDYFIPVPTDPR